MITDDILTEVVRRLNTITAGNTTPAGNTYAFTPALVARGIRLSAAGSVDAPIYSVSRGERIRDDRTPEGAQNTYAVEFVVNGITPITDRDTPSLDAEKCIADIGEAVLDGDTVDARQRCTLGGLCEDFAFDSDAITPPEPDDKLISSSITFAAVIQGRRGHFH